MIPTSLCAKIQFPIRFVASRKIQIPVFPPVLFSSQSGSSFFFFVKIPFPIRVGNVRGYLVYWPVWVHGASWAERPGFEPRRLLHEGTTSWVHWPMHSKGEWWVGDRRRRGEPLEWEFGRRSGGVICRSGFGAWKLEGWLGVRFWAGYTCLFSFNRFRCWITCECQ